MTKMKESVFDDLIKYVNIQHNNFVEFCNLYKSQKKATLSKLTRRLLMNQERAIICLMTKSFWSYFLLN
ncbi:hypothetical protein SDC9_97723 [bioreactor metagenome]|uniref:Uncharacterized protein n=1 Tax=bioreactor metagenome TaxID=1076179 RepID=A0A645AD79_9ZZZZ